MKYDPRVPMPGFPRRELLKLMSMLMLLVVIGMMMYRTRDPAMWKWMAEDDTVRVNGTDNAVQVSEADDAVETLVAGPNDQQPFEWSQAEYQFQAVSDKTPLAVEEMPSYWRLMRWTLTQPFDELWERAHKDRYFTHLGQNPAKHRGELIALRVSLRRSLRGDATKNSAGVKEVFEAWGVTSESRTALYCLIFPDLPPQIPVKPNIHEEADFVGYFHKLMSYEDALGKTRWVPVLIGRLQWRENPARVALARRRSEYGLWPWVIGGAVGVFFAVVIWTQRYLAAGHVAHLAPKPVDHAAIERWLESGGETVTPGVTGVIPLPDEVESDTGDDGAESSNDEPITLPIESGNSEKADNPGMPIDRP